MSTINAPTGRTGGRESLHRALVEALNFEIPQRTLPVGYRVGLVLLVIMLAAMSLAFAGLVMFLGWVAIWHVYNAVVSFEAGPYFIFHGPMALLGILLVLVLIKPVFLRDKERDGARIVLRRDQEPLLFEYVERLCRAAGAPVPHSIEVDCAANAHARMAGGIMGLLGRRMVLRIGLPLAGALPVHQFAGILAHEIGHLSQRGGTFTQHLLRGLNLFFAKIVFQRDRLDAILERLRIRGGVIGSLFYLLAVVFIEPARGVLFLMLLIGDSLSAHVLRRMEYDADLLEAQVYGSAEFERVSQTLAFLNVAQQRALSEMAQTWENGRLADDFAALIVAESQYLSKHHADLIAHVEKQKTRWFDTHPSHSQRVNNVREAALEPLLTSSVPARALFSDFAGLCKTATIKTYFSILGEEYKKAKLVPTAEMAAELSRQHKGFKTLDDFFCGHAIIEVPLFPQAEAGTPVLDVDQTVEQLKQSRDAMAREAAGLGPVVESLVRSILQGHVAAAQHDLADLFPAMQAGSLLRCADRQLQKEQQVQSKARLKTLAFTMAAERRFTLALDLAATPQFVEKMHHGSGIQRILSRYLPLATAMRKLMPEVQALMRDALAVRVLCSAHNDAQPYIPLVNRIIKTDQQLLAGVKRVADALDRFAYPFEHATAGITAGRSLLDEKLPPEKDPPAVHAYASVCIDRFHALAMRILSQLALVAATVEKAIGLAPLAAPREEEALPRGRAGLRFWTGYGVRAAAGLLLVGTLLWWSYSPPQLPAMSWGAAPEGKYRPAAFVASVEHFNRYEPSAYTVPQTVMMASPGGIATGQSPGGPPRMPFGAPTFTPSYSSVQVTVPAIPIPGISMPPGAAPPPYQPGRPGYYGQPGVYPPGYPGNPGMPTTPGVPRPPTPPTYTPPRPAPTYTPPRPGGGGSQPGGGYSPGGGGARPGGR